MTACAKHRFAYVAKDLWNVEPLNKPPPTRRSFAGNSVHGENAPVGACDVNCFETSI